MFWQACCLFYVNYLKSVEASMFITACSSSYARFLLKSQVLFPTTYMFICPLLLSFLPSDFDRQTLAHGVTWRPRSHPTDLKALGSRDHWFQVCFQFFLYPAPSTKMIFWPPCCLFNVQYPKSVETSRFITACSCSYPCFLLKSQDLFPTTYMLVCPLLLNIGIPSSYYLFLIYIEDLYSRTCF